MRNSGGRNGVIVFFAFLAAFSIPYPAPGAEAPNDSEKTPLVGSVVRSREYVIRRAPSKQEEFIGEVSYRRDTRLASADWALYEHEPQLWTLRGHVHGEDRLKDGSLLLVEGYKALHDMKTGFGELRASEGELVRLTRTWSMTPSKPAADRASARQLFWDEKGGTIRLEGQVRIDSPLGEAAARMAVYRHAERTLTLTGDRPYVMPREQGWLAAAQAEEIRVTERPQKIRAQGAVRGWIYFPPDERSPSKGSSGTRFFWPFKPRKR